MCVRETPARRKRQHDRHLEPGDHYPDHLNTDDQYTDQYRHQWSNTENQFEESANDFKDSENRFYESRNEQSRTRNQLNSLDIQDTQPNNQFIKDESNHDQMRNNRHENQFKRKQRRPHDPRQGV